MNHSHIKWTGLAERLTIQEAAGLVVKETGKPLDYTTSFLMDCAQQGYLSANVVPLSDGGNVSHISRVDPLKSTVSTAELVEWLNDEIEDAHQRAREATANKESEKWGYAVKPEDVRVRLLPWSERLDDLSGDDTISMTTRNWAEYLAQEMAELQGWTGVEREAKCAVARAEYLHLFVPLANTLPLVQELTRSPWKGAQLPPDWLTNLHMVRADLREWAKIHAPEIARSRPLADVESSQRSARTSGSALSVGSASIFPAAIQKLSLWEIACLYTRQNATDDKPTNETRHKLAELVRAALGNKLWVGLPLDLGPSFLEGFDLNASWPSGVIKWRDLGLVTVSRVDWLRYEAGRPPLRRWTAWARREPVRLSGKETTLTRYMQFDSWTPAAAAMLVSGLQAPTVNGQLCAEIPDDGEMGLDSRQKRASFLAFAVAKGVLERWRAQENPPATVRPFDFIVWCRENGIDTAWLRSIENAPQWRKEFADAWLRQQNARKHVPPTVIEEAIGKYGNLLKALFSPADVQVGPLSQTVAAEPMGAAASPDRANDSPAEADPASGAKSSVAWRIAVEKQLGKLAAAHDGKYPGHRVALNWFKNNDAEAAFVPDNKDDEFTWVKADGKRITSSFKTFQNGVKEILKSKQIPD
jgi:hypothetical protein